MLTNEKTKKHFFTDVEGVLVFDKVKFQQVVNNKQFLPGSYTIFKNKIGLSANNSDLLTAREDISLVFPHKDCVLEGGQTKEDQKRDEVFYNEILAPDEIDTLLAPKVFTNFKKFDKNGEHKIDKIDIEKDNLIIKGNNLLAMSSLLERYRGKVKCIYIDPPYYFSSNKDSDSFSYNTNFKLASWLVFMKNRLVLANKMLTNNGVLFIQISDDGYSYLKNLCDTCLSLNYLNTIIVKAKASSGASGGGEDKKLKKNVEYILVYAKKDFIAFNNVYQKMTLSNYIASKKIENKSFAYKSVLVDSGEDIFIKTIAAGNGDDIKLYKKINYKIKSISELMKEEKLTQEQVYKKYINSIFTTENAQTSIRTRVKDADIENNEFVIAKYFPISGKNKGKEIEVGFIGSTKRLVSYLSNLCVVENDNVYKLDKVGTLWDDISWSSVSDEGNVSLENGKKPEILIKRVLELSSYKNDLVMDFHLGSGTTAAVAHKMGRRYIGIEQLDYNENDSVVRLKNVINGDQTGISKEVNWQGGGDFIYCELKELNQKYVDMIDNANDDNSLIQLWNIMQENAFLSYKVDVKQVNANITDFKLLSMEDKKQFLMEVLDKNLLYVNYSDMLDEEMNVSEEDKKLNANFYEV